MLNFTGTPGKTRLEDFGRRMQVRMRSSFHFHCEAQASARAGCWEFHSKPKPLTWCPMPELARILLFPLTSKGAARDWLPTRRGPPHPPSPEKGCADIIPNNRAAAIYSPSLHYKKQASSGAEQMQETKTGLL